MVSGEGPSPGRGNRTYPERVDRTVVERKVTNMEAWKRQKYGSVEIWKRGSRQRRNAMPIFQSFNFSISQSLTRMLVFMGVIAVLLPIGTPTGFAAETQPANGNRANTKEEQSRQIQIETKRLEMELKEQLMKKKLVELENLKAMMMEANNIVTVSEVNKAEEDYETAVSEYEQAKLTLQEVELNSLKDEWHITVENTNLI